MVRTGLTTLVICAVLFLSAVFLARRQLAPVDPTGHEMWFRVESGESLHTVAVELDHLGLIREQDAFSWLGRLRGESGQLKPGRYRLSPAQSSNEILSVLVNGETHPIRIVFPEGIWLGEIAAIVADSLGIPADSVVVAASDRELLRRFDVQAESAEGYLFPATYEFTGREHAHEVVEMLLANGLQRWTTERAARAESLGWGRHQALTMASIVEAETGIPTERPMVSAVYHRRLARGMLLQADPTVSYGLRVRGRGPSLAELKSETRYNTYVHPGLPPGPIGNPGDAAIDAALWPDPNCRALFFVAREDGSHTFTRTFEDHLAAVRARNGR